MKAHSWHPNPFLIKSPINAAMFGGGRWTPRRRGKARPAANGPGEKFCEASCASGVLGHFYAVDILPLMMANALKFKKFGA